MRIINTQPGDPLAGNALNGIVFAGFMVVSAVAAQSSLAQLSEIGSATCAIQLIDIIVSLASAGDVVLSSYGTNLAGAGGRGISTAYSANTSAALLRFGNAAAIPGTQMERWSLPAAQSVSIMRPWAYAIPPNSSVVVAAVTQNVAMTVTFRFVEITG